MNLQTRVRLERITRIATWTVVAALFFTTYVLSWSLVGIDI